MNAWLITWEGTDKSITDENKIAGVLSGRYSSSYIEKLVDFLYHRTKFNVHDMAYFSNKRKAREHQSKAVFSTFARIFYGTNPCLYARQVKDFRVKYDEEHEIEIISWVENALYVNDADNGYKLKEIEPEVKKVLRALNIKQLW